MNLNKKTDESRVKEIGQNTRKKYSAEEKIRIVMEGLLSESFVNELCRREGINTSLYYRWRKDFLEADKTRLARVIKREATTTEVRNFKVENMYLMQLVAELSLENRILKKRLVDIK